MRSLLRYSVNCESFYSKKFLNYPTSYKLWLRLDIIYYFLKDFLPCKGEVSRSVIAVLPFGILPRLTEAFYLEDVS